MHSKVERYAGVPQVMPHLYGNTGQSKQRSESWLAGWLAENTCCAAHHHKKPKGFQKVFQPKFEPRFINIYQKLTTPVQITPAHQISKT
jgi:hypothetical protein